MAQSIYITSAEGHSGKSTIALMGLAASFIARLLQRYPWIAYVGLAIILYVAFDMIYRGGLEVWPYVSGYLGGAKA